jgi:uncharacterized protein YoxC
MAQQQLDIHVRTEQKVDALTKLVKTLIQKVNIIMADLDQVKSDEDAEAAAISGLSTAVTALIGTINSLKDQLAKLPLSVADQAKVDAIFAEAESNKVAAQAALSAAQAVTG